MWGQVGGKDLDRARGTRDELASFACASGGGAVGVSPGSMVPWSYRLIGIEGNNAALAQLQAVVDRAAFLVSTVSAESRIDAQKVIVPLALANVFLRCFADAVAHTLRRSF